MNSAATTLSPPKPMRAFAHPGLAVRVLWMIAALALEKTAVRMLLDRSLETSVQGAARIAVWLVHGVSSFLVAFTLMLAALLVVRRNERLLLLNAEARALRWRIRPLLWHAACVALLLSLSPFVFAPQATLVVNGLWTLAALGVLVSAVSAVAPVAMLRAAIAAIAPVASLAALAAVAGTVAMSFSQRLWAPAAGLTFELVRGVLAPWLPTLQADPVERTLSTGRFAIRVSEACSGLEGVGMMLALCVAWLLVFRREYVLRRAWLLLPVGVVLIFACNVLRIAALMLIGHTGHPDLAVSGFHSQAGWIAFNAVSLGMLYASRRSRWMNLHARADAQAIAAGDNPTVQFLLPLVVILGTGILTAALSTGFDTLYGLRWVAGAAALAAVWPRLAALDWRCTWRGPAAGVAVFVLWLLAARVQLHAAAMPDTLAALSPGARALWIAVRALAAMTTVPLAEELAYRGFLMRRIDSADFEQVPMRSVGWPALLISSVVFGIAHGAMWLPGVAAGLVYGLIARRTGRIGEAVAAHATTNALLVAVVLGWGQWQLW